MDHPKQLLPCSASHLLKHMKQVLCCFRERSSQYADCHRGCEDLRLLYSYIVSNYTQKRSGWQRKHRLFWNLLVILKHRYFVSYGCVRGLFLCVSERTPSPKSPTDMFIEGRINIFPWLHGKLLWEALEEHSCGVPHYLSKSRAFYTLKCHCALLGMGCSCMLPQHHTEVISIFQPG